MLRPVPADEGSGSGWGSKKNRGTLVLSVFGMLFGEEQACLLRTAGINELLESCLPDSRHGSNPGESREGPGAFRFGQQ